MTLFRESDPRFQGLSAKVALFVVLGLAAAIGLVVALAVQQGYFTAKTELYFEAPTGIDLRSGMAVKLSGFKIGEVRSVALNEAARVDVLMRIEDQYLKWIKADSVASIAREGLIGDSYIVITSGDPALPSLQAGERIVYEPTPALADIAADLRVRTLPVIEGVTKMLQYFNDPKGDFRASMTELRKLVSEFRETRRSLDTLLADLDTVAREDVTRTLANTDRTLASIEKDVSAISTRTDQSLAKLDEATASAKEAADTATKAIDSASPRIDRLLDTSNKAVRDGRKLINGASKRWPFRGGEVPADEEETTPAAVAP